VKVFPSKEVEEGMRQRRWQQRGGRKEVRNEVIHEEI
jgi:hypothetical protein